MAEIVLDLSGSGLVEALAFGARFILGWTLISFGAAVLWSLAAWTIRRRRAARA
jgi:hypothetical protein